MQPPLRSCAFLPPSPLGAEMLTPKGVHPPHSRSHSPPLSASPAPPTSVRKGGTQTGATRKAGSAPPILARDPSLPLAPCLRPRISAPSPSAWKRGRKGRVTPPLLCPRPHLLQREQGNTARRRKGMPPFPPTFLPIHPHLRANRELHRKGYAPPFAPRSHSCANRTHRCGTTRDKLLRYR